MSDKIKTYRLYEERDRWEYDIRYPKKPCVRTNIIEDGNLIVKVHGEFENGEIFILEYKKIEISEIKQILLDEGINDFRGRYFKDFTISSLKLGDEFIVNGLNADYSYWDGNTNFHKCAFGNGDVTFIGANFSDGEVRFTNIILKSGNLDFYRSYFSNCRFLMSKSHFYKCNIIFSYSNFQKTESHFDMIYFKKSNFYFNNANFSLANINFSGSLFNGKHVSFTSSIFSECNIDFNGVDFGECTLNFKNVKVKGDRIIFDYAKFGKNTCIFEISNFDVTILRFESTIINSREFDFQFAEFNKSNIFFNKTNFGNGNISFYKVRADFVQFRESNFFAYTDLRFSKINKLYLIDCSINSLIKISGDFQELSFENSINLGCIDLNWEQPNVKETIKNYYIKDHSRNDEKLEKNAILNPLPYIDLNKQFQYDYAAHDFLLLKENYHNMGQYEWEDEAYRAYMEYKTIGINVFWDNKAWKEIEDRDKRKSEKKRIKKGIRQRLGKKLFNIIFGKISGYGTEPVKIIKTCLITMVISALLYFISILNTNYNFSFKCTVTCKEILEHLGQSIYFSIITFLTIGYKELEPINWFMRSIACIEGFLGLLFMSILTVTIMRKVLR